MSGLCDTARHRLHSRQRPPLAPGGGLANTPELAGHDRTIIRVIRHVLSRSAAAGFMVRRQQNRLVCPAVLPAAICAKAIHNDFCALAEEERFRS
jgi:hypothetical protein